MGVSVFVYMCFIFITRVHVYVCIILRVRMRFVRVIFLCICLFICEICFCQGGVTVHIVVCVFCVHMCVSVSLCVRVN